MSQAPAEHPDFESFWLHFLSSHDNAAVRWCHVAGLACGVAGIAIAGQKWRLWPALLGGGAFAALAILSHPLLAGNWPENFGHPRWGARAFLRLCARTVTGTLARSTP